MKVTLAYPYEGHAPDETIDVDDVVGAQLIGDGWARHPGSEAVYGDTVAVYGDTVAELRQYADDNGIDLGDARRKGEILEAIEAHQAGEVPSSTVVDGDPT